VTGPPWPWAIVISLKAIQRHLLWHATQPARQEIHQHNHGSPYPLQLACVQLCGIATSTLLSPSQVDVGSAPRPARPMPRLARCMSQQTLDHQRQLSQPSSASAAICMCVWGKGGAAAENVPWWTRVAAGVACRQNLRTTPNIGTASWATRLKIGNLRTVFRNDVNKLLSGSPLSTWIAMSSHHNLTALS
jgi:hypothetical protein